MLQKCTGHQCSVASQFETCSNTTHSQLSTERGSFSLRWVTFQLVGCYISHFRARASESERSIGDAAVAKHRRLSTLGCLFAVVHSWVPLLASPPPPPPSSLLPSPLMIRYFSRRNGTRRRPTAAWHLAGNANSASNRSKARKGTTALNRRLKPSKKQGSLWWMTSRVRR